jgi:hypothetical protein
MHMGREREIVRWEVHESLLTDAIARAEAELAALPPEAARGERERARALALHDQLAELRRRRHDLGPSPRAKMG